MIKETDASKNDERHVKSKLNPLTHKRKGETRTMYNQSTKHWKLGAFFVISLMLIAGLFSNTAFAQSAKITVSPTTTDSKKVVHGTFYADDIVDLTVTYTVTARAIDPGNDNIDGDEDNLATDNANLPGDPPGANADPVREMVNTVVFTLPLGATYPLVGTQSFVLAVTEYGDGVNEDNVLQDNGDDLAIPLATERGGTRRVKVIKPNATSYVTWDKNLSAGLKVVTTPIISISGQDVTVTVMITRDDESKATMKKGNTVTVTYHNVAIGEAGLFVVSATDTAMVVDPDGIDGARIPADDLLDVSVNVEELEELADTAGNVDVTPTFSAEGTEDLVVKYTASKGLAVRNSKAKPEEDLDSTYGRVQITLPAWLGS